MRRKVSLFIVLMLITLTVVGCGHKKELETPPTLSFEDIINEETLGDEKSEECPEGYVYDYQVSMEPIPKEIADLGGDVCGTIHAYPTRIQIALTKQEIENDVELQKQNEKNIEGVKEYLAETYGGEFEIEPLTTGIWSYLCTDKNTDKENVIFISPSYVNGWSDEIVTADNYFYEEDGYIYNDIVGEVIDNTIQKDNIYKIFLEQVGVSANLKLYIAIFSENAPDYLDEQKIILEIYETMKRVQEDSENNITIKLVLTYFPVEYQPIILKQYEKSVDEFAYIYGKVAEMLIQNGEVYAQFCVERDKGIEITLDEVLKEKETYLENEYKVEYWR